MLHTADMAEPLLTAGMGPISTASFSAPPSKFLIVSLNVCPYFISYLYSFLKTSLRTIFAYIYIYVVYVYVVSVFTCV